MRDYDGPPTQRRLSEACDTLARMTYASGSEKGGPVYRARSVAELAGIVQAYGEGELVADEAADEIDAVQVVMLPEQFERFREWLNHDLDTDVF